MPASYKKVILRKWSRDWLPGYLPPSAFIHQGELSILDLAGKTFPVRLCDLKWVCFVREFPSGETSSPERLLRKTFSGRPRSPGIWVRVRLNDNELIEGVAQNDLTLLDPDGLFLTPPDTRSNTQRIFVPRDAVAELEVLAVVRLGLRKGPQTAIQESLFKQPAP